MNEVNQLKDYVRQARELFLNLHRRDLKDYDYQRKVDMFLNETAHIDDDCNYLENIGDGG